MDAIGGTIKFIDYKVTKVEYELNQDFEWRDEAINIKIDSESEREISEDGTQMIATLKIRVFDDGKGDYPFRMVVQLEGLFQLSANSIAEDIEKYYANALSILYPYARAIVSNYTASANIEPLILPTVNIYKMIEKGNQTD